MEVASITIREAQAHEFEKVGQLRRAEGEDAMQGSIQRTKVKFAEISQQKRVCLFAEVEGNVVGSVQVQFYIPVKQLADGKDIAHADDLYVAYAYRSRGIGKRLMRALENTAREYGFLKLTLGVRHGDSYGFLTHWYRSLGYRYWQEKEDGTATLFIKEL